MKASDQANRLQGLVVMLAVFVPVTAVGSAFSPGNRLVTAVAMACAFSVLIVILMAMWSFRPAWYVAWAGPLNDLAPEDRRLVSRAVRSGQGLGDPRLAEVAVSVAGRMARAAWLIVGAAALNVAIRCWSLATAPTTAARVVGVMSVSVWAGYLGYGFHRVSCARRAERLNRATVRQVGGRGVTP